MSRPPGRCCGVGSARDSPFTRARQPDQRRVLWGARLVGQPGRQHQPRLTAREGKAIIRRQMARKGYVTCSP